MCRVGGACLVAEQQRLQEREWKREDELKSVDNNWK